MSGVPVPRSSSMRRPTETSPLLPVPQHSPLNHPESSFDACGVSTTTGGVVTMSTTSSISHPPRHRQPPSWILNDAHALAVRRGRRRGRGLGLGRPLLLVVVVVVTMAVAFFAGFVVLLFVRNNPIWDHHDQVTDSSSRWSSSSRSATAALLSRTTMSTAHTPSMRTFPSTFVWGVATSSYQIEGAAQEDGREPSIWDDFCRRNGTIMDGTSGDVACDHYHAYRNDVKLMASLGFNAYRFSVSWSRLVHSDRTINPVGLQFYNDLIDELLAHNITPWVTMHHWDLPSSLPGGWRNASTVEAFVHYASVLFDEFGDRVVHWITVNEPWTISVNGYATGVHAPGILSDTDPYIVGHHLLLAHAKAVQLFRTKFGSTHKIGMANCGDYRYPRDPNNPDHVQAARRAMQFQWGWFVHPLVHGDYPSEMRSTLGARLPHFTAHEQQLVKDSYDFLGLNYYSSLLASSPDAPPAYSGYWADMGVNLTMAPERDRNDMGWSVVPAGLRDMLRWIAVNYHDPILYVTENGSAEPESTLDTAQHDTRRQFYFQQHLTACAEALHGGDSDEQERGGGVGHLATMKKVNVRGYFAWSLMDNFEWQFGYQRRFGICRVDFDSPELYRTPKGSAFFLRDTIRANGANLPSRLASDLRDDVDSLRLARQVTEDEAQLQRDLVQTSSHSRPLPDRVVLGYGSNVQAVKKAVRDGLNVVVWSFVDFRSDPDVPWREPMTPHDLRTSDARLLDAPVRTVTNLNLTEVRDAIHELDREGYNDTVHLMSVGGWNGPHLDPAVSALDWYEAYRTEVGGLFHGLDWDLEGNDDLGSMYNVFTVECLDKMADISRLAKAEGYIVGMAPPQSYLDAFDGGSHRFSRYVNLTDASRTWHNDFSYFGANVYAYLLHKAGDWIDLVFLQFYESYSRASMAIALEGISPSVYLERFVSRSLQGSDLIGSVEFDDDSQTKIPTRVVRVPLSKLVLGLANGWADNGDDKTLFITTKAFDTAWSSLSSKGIEPRGAGFWTIDEEGTNGAYFARDLSRTILRHHS